MLPVGLSKFSRRLFSAVAIVALAIPASAQITTTGIHGLVRDPSGAIVPGATLKLQDTSTGIEKATVSSSDGVFAFANLQTGTYKLTVTSAGFQTAVVNAVTVDSGRTTDVNIDMKVGTS